MAGQDNTVRAATQMPLSADPIKIVVNRNDSSTDGSQHGNIKYSLDATVTLRFADGCEISHLKTYDDDIYEVETAVGSASRGASSRPSLSPSLMSSRTSLYGNSEGNLLGDEDDCSSVCSDKENDDVLRGASLVKHMEPSQRWQYQNAHGYVPPYPSTFDQHEAHALELEIAAAELKVAALRAEAAAKRVRTGNMRPDSRVDSVQRGSSAPPQAANQVSTCQFEMFSTSPCTPAPQISRQTQSWNSGGTTSCASRHSNTTVMLRNVPNDYTRDMVVELLESLGFGACFDFVYVPFDFKRCSGLGYAFVNFNTHEHATHAMASLSGFYSWKVQSRKILQASWTDSWQGLAANIERYRNSPVMHPEVPERFKPSLYSNGSCVPFPPPTKTIAKPTFA